MKSSIFVLLLLPFVASAVPTTPYATGFDVLKMPDGSRISSAAEWNAKVKPQIFAFFEKNVYGPLPPKPAKVEFVEIERSDDALGGLAKRRQYQIVSTDAEGTHAFDVLVYLPKAAKGTVPAFVCPNFSGNHSITDDPGVKLPTCRIYKGVKATEEGRGGRPERIPVRDIVARGFAIATFCHSGLYVDHGLGEHDLKGSIWEIFPPARRPLPMALPAWAWGNMRTLDLLETISEVDAKKVAVVGQSRLAKVAVITAAYDERFRLCCPNDGGCKTLTLCPNLMFPSWFAPGLTNWTEIAKSALPSAETAKLRGDKPPIPFDQASLIGCIAPRALYLGASHDDVYAPPDLHFAAVCDVSPVWRLFGKTRLPDASHMLSPEPFFGDISWHCKPGPHSITRVDWVHYLDFAAKLFEKDSEATPCDLQFARVAARRFVLDNELTLCEMDLKRALVPSLEHPSAKGLRVVGGFWPAAHYAAEITALPAEIAFADVKGNVAMRFAAPTDVAPPYTLDVLMTCRHTPAVFVRKDGETRLVATPKLPADFNPRLKANLTGLKFCVSENVAAARASLSAGIGQADVRFVTRGRENAPYLEDGRVFFTFSARAYGAYQAVASFDPSLFDVRLEGVILFDYGDGELRNDLAAHLFHDDVDGEWKAYVSNFSTGSDALNKRAEGGLNVATSRESPLRGLKVMRARSLGLKGMNEDPCATWDAAAKRWRLLVSEFTPKGIRASLWESERWDGPFVRRTPVVDRDSTGTTIQTMNGRRYVFSGSADRACYVYGYPGEAGKPLPLLGRLQFDLPPWNAECPNGRVWPCFAELPEGYPFRFIVLTMDRRNFPGMPNPNWTYGGLYLYGANLK